MTLTVGSVRIDYDRDPLHKPLSASKARTSKFMRQPSSVHLAPGIPTMKDASSGFMVQGL